MKFTENVVAVFVLLGIMGVAVTATLSMTPVPARTSQISGISTNTGGEILSNPLEMQVTDLHKVSPNYQTQLVKLDSTHYKYVVRLGKQSAGRLTKDFVTISNPNAGDRTAQITVKVPSELQTSVAISLLDKAPQHIKQVYSPVEGSQPTTFTIGTAQSLTLGVNYDFTDRLGFDSELEFEISF